MRLIIFALISVKYSHMQTFNTFVSDLRGSNVKLLGIIFPVLLPISCLAATSHFSCSVPQKMKSDKLSINWLERTVSFQHYKSVSASYWSSKVIQWKHPILTKDFRFGQRNLSVQLNLGDMTLMYSILDSEPVLPESDQEWALFLPVYMQCKEFF